MDELQRWAKKEFPVELSRPRQLEDISVAVEAREILDDLREEINKSLNAEYTEEVWRRPLPASNDDSRRRFL